MALEMILESLEDLDESLHEHYLERDGHWELEANGAKSQTDVDKLNGALAKERTEHKTLKVKIKAYGEYTPDSIEELVAKNEDLTLQVEAAGTDDAEEREKRVNDLAESRAVAKLKPVERELKRAQDTLSEVTGERDKLRTATTRSKIQKAVTDAALDKEVGIQKDAMEDVALFSSHAFEENELGEVVSKDGISGIIPGMTPKEAFLEMKSNSMRKLWFGETKGAGAGGGKGGESFGDNPFKEENFNFTRIAQITGSDPEKAKRMARAAHTKDWNAMKYLPASLRG